jgi:hypothetical protein
MNKRSEALREKIFNIVTDPPCHYWERTMGSYQRYCEFWDVQGHYCFLKDMHELPTKCKLLSEILQAIKEAGMVWLAEDQSLPENPYSPPLDKTQEIWSDIVVATHRAILKANFKKIKEE